MGPCQDREEPGRQRGGEGRSRGSWQPGAGREASLHRLPRENDIATEDRIMLPFHFLLKTRQKEPISAYFVILPPPP